MKLFPILMAAAFILQAADSSISIRTHVNKTALYPGDRLEYEVSVEHPASIEFIADHLKKDQLSLDGFEVVDVTNMTSTFSGGKLFQVKFLLRTFDISGAVATIPSFDLYYFRRGSGQDANNAQAETVTVPATAIALRSTLPGPNASIRDSKPLLAVSSAAWLVPGAVGACALIAVIVWLLSLVVTRLRLGSSKQRAKDGVHRQSLAERLDEIRALEVDSSEDVERFYRQASDLLRGLTGNGAGLTPQETELALRNGGGSERRAAAVGALLEQCDRIRYAPGGLEKGLNQRSEFLRKLQELAGER